MEKWERDFKESVKADAKRAEKFLLIFGLPTEIAIALAWIFPTLGPCLFPFIAIGLILSGLFLLIWIVDTVYAS